MLIGAADISRVSVETGLKPGSGAQVENFYRICVDKFSIIYLINA